jgi:hypothetical protein
VFGRRPTRFEKSCAQYIVDMRLNPQPTTIGFLTQMQATHPLSQAKFADVWRRLKDFFDPVNDTAYSGLQEMINIQALVEAFQREQYIQDGNSIQPAPNVAPAPAILEPRSTSDHSASSRTSGDTASRISNTTSHSTLSAEAISKMRAEYDDNFAAFKSEAWKLASGACVDDIVGQYVRDLNKESALHSFVIDFPTTILNLFPNPDDKVALTEVLEERSWGEKFTNSTEEAYIRGYNKEPLKLVEVLSQGWPIACEDGAQSPDILFCQSVHLALHHIYVVYNNYQFTLPEEAPESFYAHTLWGFISMLFLQDKAFIFRTAEVHSHASFLRKNKDRKVEGTTRQAVGRKVDGLVISRSTLLELCVIEMARKDAGPNDTKALRDTRKLSKVLKDSFDAICMKSTKDISSELSVFGLRIASRSITFYTMRKLDGRLYQLCNDGTVSFPLQWDEENTVTILTMVASIVALRKRMSEMNNKVKEWVRQSFEMLNMSNHVSPPPTLTTPPGSPRLLPRPSPSAV